MRMRLIACALLSVWVAACSGNKSEPPKVTTDSSTTAVPIMSGDSFAFSARPSGKIPPLPAGSVTVVRFVVRNESLQLWPGKELETTDKALRLSYHILDQKGQVVTFEGLRTVIAVDVAPAAEVEVALQVKAPDTPGKYQLQPDVLQETVAWFGMTPPPKQNPPVAIEVTAAAK